MKILLLGAPNSVHLSKWAKSLSLLNIEIIVWGLSSYNPKVYEGYNVKIYSLNQSINDQTSFGKLSYLRAIPNLKEIYKKEKPDIVHAHYATSYGLLGSFLKHKPFAISVWGSDVFDFPKKSILHRYLLKWILNNADYIFSTSHNMAQETKLYTNQTITVIPFGVDLTITKPIKKKKTDVITIGSIKGLEKVYDIEFLIKSYHLLLNRLDKRIKTRLLIIGDGSQMNTLKNLVNKLDLSNHVHFEGWIPHDEINTYLNKIDIFSILSERESFGVAAVEAAACHLPVVSSNIGGLPEVVENNITGYVISKENIDDAVNAFEQLVLDDKLRVTMGKAGRKKVEREYNWEHNVQTMCNEYKKML